MCWDWLLGCFLLIHLPSPCKIAYGRVQNALKRRTRESKQVPTTVAVGFQQKLATPPFQMTFGKTKNQEPDASSPSFLVMYVLQGAVIDLNT